MLLRAGEIGNWLVILVGLWLLTCSCNLFPHVSFLGAFQDAFIFQTSVNDAVAVERALPRSHDARIWPVFLVIIYYVGCGIRSLLRGGPHEWPISTNSEPLSYRFVSSPLMLAVHATSAGIFWIGCALQSQSAKRLVEDPTFSKLHRRIGRASLICSTCTSLHALALSRVALHGTAIYYSVWTALWLLATVMTWIRIKQGDIAGHRRWATFLMRTGSLFYTARLIIHTCWLAGVPHDKSYWLGVVFSGHVNILAFLYESFRWHKLHSSLGNGSQS